MRVSPLASRMLGKPTLVRLGYLVMPGAMARSRPMRPVYSSRGLMVQL